MTNKTRNKAFEKLVSKGLSKSRYRNSETCRRDVLSVLGSFRGLAPDYDVFVFDDGVERSLVNVNGTIPVSYRCGEAYCCFDKKRLRFYEIENLEVFHLQMMADNLFSPEQMFAVVEKDKSFIVTDKVGFAPPIHSFRIADFQIPI